jgi:hypothetical protein
MEIGFAHRANPYFVQAKPWQAMPSQSTNLLTYKDSIMSTNTSLPIQDRSLFAFVAKFVASPATATATGTKAKPATGAAAARATAARPIARRLLDLYLMSAGLNSVNPGLLAERIVHD